ncbi:hypothetical protein IT970_00810 [Pseudoalteromonas sp. A41-2]|uniref:hypothetical protein n=1 Tax=Pseudoalteromonas sp. A41-2 TaxID=2785910 RepID=UPI0018C9024F|nr:hypothetical protein [Pseudoalteromonas sp. A41-2]QPL43055.1 hypothetical protein IT970_00810 [Pseudoalteromonas sp. A41-2]
MLSKKSIPYFTQEAGGEERELLLDTRNLVIDNNTIYPLKSTHEVSRLLLKIMKLYLLDSDYKEKSADHQKHTKGAFRRCIEFLNQSKTLSNKVLKEFESWEVEQYKLKPQSTNCRRLKTILSRIKNSPNLNVNEKRQIETVINSFVQSKDAEKDPLSLSSWFIENSPWLRKYMGEHFLLLESPKRLIKSFEATIGTMLNFILEARKQFASHPDLIELYMNIRNFTSIRDKQKRIINFIGALLDKPENSVTELKSFILTECSHPKHRTKICQVILKCRENSNKSSSQILYDELLYKRRAEFPFSAPESFYDQVSLTEEALMSFLFATLSIQPTDILGLTRRHIAIKTNSQGNVRLLEVDYLKGRGLRRHKPPTLRGSSLIARTTISYINNLPKHQDELFTRLRGDKNYAISLTNPFSEHKHSNHNNFQALFAKLLITNNELNTNLERELKLSGAGKVFKYAMSHFYDHNRYDRHTAASMFEKKNLTRKEYQERTQEPLPSYFFKLAHIKNTGVYSRTDLYRNEDLVNQNSHQSNTEKLSYLTDDNKEWVNQVGRITRMVMNDIESRAFRPTLEFIDKEATERNLRTKVIDSTHSTNVRINQYGEAIQSESERDLDHVIVFENSQTVITMLHYIDEAEINAKAIMQANSSFFEETLLINVEWMHHCLSQFSPDLVSKSVEDYQRLKKLNILPKLFENEIQSGMSL